MLSLFSEIACFVCFKASFKISSWRSFAKTEALKLKSSPIVFCRMLSLPTRVIFVAESSRYAAECFRLDALDYLEG